MSPPKRETVEPTPVEHKSAMRESSPMQNLETDSIGDGQHLLSMCRKPRLDLNSLTVRQYLDQTVAPILLHALQAVAKDRPTDPITFLATYLLKNRNRCYEVNAEAS
ncbi:protein dpy-30 homolog [Drosophila nasuta]|uniref:protein dpy-30 homolog n=1 Tax=Drosophila nasuta TaxID=42062 RepID=UPI00295EF2B3|nr:protein dpy-30 homolog [Drosophila nasuta]